MPYVTVLWTKHRDRRHTVESPELSFSPQVGTHGQEEALTLEMRDVTAQTHLRTRNWEPRAGSTPWREGSLSFFVKVKSCSILLIRQHEICETLGGQEDCCLSHSVSVSFLFIDLRESKPTDPTRLQTIMTRWSKFNKRRQMEKETILTRGKCHTGRIWCMHVSVYMSVCCMYMYIRVHIEVRG